MLARFREAVEQSVAYHKKKKFCRPSQHLHKHSDISSSRRSQFRCMSTNIEIATLGGGGSVGNPSEYYFHDFNDTISEEDLEVRI